MPEDSQQETISRRTLLGVSVWSVPVVAATIAIPLAAASTVVTEPPTMQSFSGMAIDWTFPGDPDTVTAASTGTVSIFPRANGDAFFSISASTTGVRATIESLVARVSAPYQITWEVPPRDWRISAPTGDTSSGFTYSITPPAGVLEAALQANSPLGTQNPFRIDIPTFTGTFPIPAGATIPRTVTTDVAVEFSRINDFSQAAGGPYTPTTSVRAGTISYQLVSPIVSRR